MKEKDESLKNVDVDTWITKGNVTEQAILNFFMKEYGGQACVDHKKVLGDIQEDIIAFTSARKKASIIVKTDGGYRIYTKGGPDFLGAAITKIIGNDG
jgi:magnesium-transporting ATPase (P-type)